MSSIPVTVYHNPRCAKSREALAYLDERKITYEVVNYINEPLTFDQLNDVIDALNIDVASLVRKNEATWKTLFADKELEDDELIFAMIEHPKLMQRPIVLAGDKAVIARPSSKIDDIL